MHHNSYRCGRACEGFVHEGANCVRVSECECVCESVDSIFKMEYDYAWHQGMHLNTSYKRISSCRRLLWIFVLHSASRAYERACECVRVCAYVHVCVIMQVGERACCVISIHASARNLPR